MYSVLEVDPLLSLSLDGGKPVSVTSNKELLRERIPSATLGPPSVLAANVGGVDAEHWRRNTRGSWGLIGVGQSIWRPDASCPLAADGKVVVCFSPNL